jgi:hypothetical protein
MRKERSLVHAMHASLLALLASHASCVGTTGGDLVSFDAAAAGPPDAIAGQALSFDTGRGWHVSLTRARLHIGAVYLNRSVPSSGSQETSCVLPGIYVGEVLGGRDVDVLSPDPQPFSARGDGIGDRAVAGELWLTGGDVNAVDDPTVILDIAGIASRGTDILPFEGQVTIGANRATGSPDPSQPGLDPPCKQRIVSPITTDVRVRAGGKLLVRIDPRGWFANVDFAQLDKASDAPLLYRFADASSGQPAFNLFKGVHAAEGVYRFSWESP